MATGSYLSVTTLIVNGLNTPTKKQRLAEWIQKQDPCIRCLKETHLKPRDTYRLKVKGQKKIFHANGDQKKAGLAILISDKIDFEIMALKRDKDNHWTTREFPTGTFIQPHNVVTKVNVLALN